LTAPAGSPGLISRAFPGGPGIGIGVTNDSSLGGGWEDWPTSAVPPPMPPANSLLADPFMFFDSQRTSWGMIVATCLGGTDYSNCRLPRVQLYEAQTLPPTNWTFVSNFFVGPAETGIRPECPRLWRFSAPPSGCPDGSRDNMTLLVYSSTLQGRSLWFLGRVNASMVFIPSSSGLVDWGSFYAAHMFGGPDGWGAPNLTVVGWLQELRPQTPVNVTPWFNLLSLPRATSLAPDCTRISAQPAEWTRALRSKEPVWTGNVSVPASAGNSSVIELPFAVGATGSSLWLDATLVSWGLCDNLLASPSSAGVNSTWSVLVLATSSNGTYLQSSTERAQSANVTALAEYTSISVSRRVLTVNLSTSSLNENTGHGVFEATAANSSEGFRGFSVLIDQNAVETFAHSDILGEAVISVFAYPTLTTSTGVFLAADTDACVSIAAFAMPSSSSAR
jgi:sucrose-6-phosphate hydrolase SacC (GH32 family)